nr:hypothetical protein [Tanacetum cinerariifolium]
QRERADGGDQQPARVAVVVAAEHDGAEDTGAAEQQQDNRGHLAAHLGHDISKGLDVAVGGELRSNDQRGQHIERHQRRTLEQDRQAAQRT